jgi:hypothetical protein
MPHSEASRRNPIVRSVQYGPFQYEKKMLPGAVVHGGRRKSRAPRACARTARIAVRLSPWTACRAAAISFRDAIG